MELKQRAYRYFERQITPQVTQKIEEEFDLKECRRGIQLSTFDVGRLKLLFEPSEEEFRRIVERMRPARIYYHETNEDDAGSWGGVCIKPSDIAEIYSRQYIFGYPGIWNQLEAMGYSNEVATSGFKNKSGVFVLNG